MMKLENNTIKKLNKNSILKDKIRKKKTSKQTNQLSGCLFETAIISLKANRNKL
jgi:hypothetical protein